MIRRKYVVANNDMNAYVAATFLGRQAAYNHTMSEYGYPEAPDLRAPLQLLNQQKPLQERKILFHLAMIAGRTLRARDQLHATKASKLWENLVDIEA